MNLRMTESMETLRRIDTTTSLANSYWGIPGKGIYPAGMSGLTSLKHCQARNAWKLVQPSKQVYPLNNLQ